MGQEDHLEESLTTYSSILAETIPWIEEPGGLQSMGLQEVGHDWNVHWSLKQKEKSVILMIIQNFDIWFVLILIFKNLIFIYY